MTLVVRSEPCTLAPLMRIGDVTTGVSSGYFELYPGSSQTLAPFIWEGSGDLERYKKYTSQVAPLRIISLRQVRLLAHGLLIDQADRIYPPSQFFADEVFDIEHPVNTLTDAYCYDAATQSATLTPGLTERRISEPCLVLSQCGWDIYGHWLLDILPKLPVRWLFPERVKVLLPTGLAPWQSDFLRLLGVEADDLVTYDPRSEIVSLDCAICVSHPRQYYSMNPFANIAYDAVSAGVGAQRSEGQGRRLYVSRRQITSGKQQLLNSDEVVELLTRRGFDIVDPETMSPREQVACFAQAELVIGEQGSGLHNTAFSSRGTGVICLHSERAQFFAQAGLGYIRSQPTGFIFGSHRADRDAYGTDRVFEVPVATLARVLDENVVLPV